MTYPRNASMTVRPLGGAVGFVRGALDVWRGFAFLLARPGLWIWALIPFILNIAIFALCAWAGWHYFDPWLQGHTAAAAGGGWLAWLWKALAWLAEAFFWLVVGLVVIFAFIPVATLVAAPFNDILSEKVERLYSGVTAAGFHPAGFARSLWISIKVSLWLSLRTLLLLALTLPLYLIPGVGSMAASALAAAISIWFLSLQFTAYSMDRRFYSYARRAEFQRRHRARALGLGAMAFAVMLVPVVNALFIPVSAVAGTLLFCEVGGE